MGVYDIDGNNLLEYDSPDGLGDLLQNRVLIWHDEFKGVRLDSSKWHHQMGRTSSNEYAVYAEDADKVISVHDGLTYRCIKDNPYPESGITHRAAYISTSGIFEFMYGRIEAKIKFPNNTAHHTTFWTLGANNHSMGTDETSLRDGSKGVKFPSCGEIDIAEFENNVVGGRMHWASDGFDGTTYASGGNVQNLTNTPNEWHIYAAEWTSTNIEFFVDGVSKGSWDISNATVDGWNPFNHPHYIILNCIAALTGTPTWDVAETNVQWVRVYAPAGSQKVVETGISIPATASISVGERHWLGTPTFTPANPSDMTVKWKSHNEDIVTCYGGMLIGVSAGATYVQAKSKHGYTALCKVTVS